MKRLTSYVWGEWNPGEGKTRSLANPTTEAVIAETTTSGIDMAKVMDFARNQGGPALRSMSFAQRGEMLKNMAKAIHEGREELIALAIENGGNTRSDAKFDIDGASFTLSSYGDLGLELGNTKVMVDGDPIQVGRTARLSGQHIYLPREGVAVHINAFNFPAWGTAEKLAASFLAGMPVVSKPATATALVAHRMTEIFVERDLMPKGSCSLLCGGAGTLLDQLRGQDVLAFTGSSDTAQMLRSNPAIIKHSVHVNVEADSLNAAVLFPDVALDSETGRLFVADVVRDMTQKTGQKCTAIRRVMVPKDRVDEVTSALAEKLADLKVGNPSEPGVRMGPLATQNQLKDVKARLGALIECTEEGYGKSGEIVPIGCEKGKGFFLGPVLRKTMDAKNCLPLHQEEIFGPVSTVAGFSGQVSDAIELIQMGGGGLVTSIYSDDKDTLKDAVMGMAPFHGRLYLGSDKMAAQSPGPGTVLPTLLHGGPGRAGGGEELGGRRGMALYQQRTAIQGDKRFLAAICEG